MQGGLGDVPLTPADPPARPGPGGGGPQQLRGKSRASGPLPDALHGAVHGVQQLWQAVRHGRRCPENRRRRRFFSG